MLSIIRSPPPVQQQPQPPQQQQQIIRPQVQQTPAPPASVAPTSGAATNTITVGPDQQQVFYTVSGEDGKTQQYMMLCPKDMDQNTLITTLVRQISADPTNKGKKTIRITQHKSAPGGMLYFGNFLMATHSMMGKDMTLKISNTNKISIFDISKV